MITQKRLKELLDYEPDTGIWRWIKNRKVAGSIDRKGYRIIGVDRNVYRAHRLAFLYMNGEWPTEQVDHINSQKDDNRWSNLRAATNAENRANVGKNRNNKTGYKGVSIFNCKGIRKYQSTISCKGKWMRLGFFDTAEEAYEAYCNAAKLYHKDFARTN